jgi:hypothetical protein
MTTRMDSANCAEAAEWGRSRRLCRRLRDYLTLVCGK